MNTLAFVITANLLAVFVIFCGLKLFDLGSELAEPIRRYGVFLGIVFAIVAIFNFLLQDALELIDGDYIFWLVFVGMLGFSFVGFFLDICKRCLVMPKRKKSRKLGRASKWSVTAVALIEVMLGAIAGAVAGLSFANNSGTGVMVICALVLLILANKVFNVRFYMDARFSRREIVTILAGSLLIIPVTASLTYLWAHARYRHIGVFLALAIGYLVYLCLYHLVIIVKKHQNR